MNIVTQQMNTFAHLDTLETPLSVSDLTPGIVKRHHANVMTTIKQRILMQRWFLIRVLLCAGAALSGFFAPLSEGNFGPEVPVTDVISMSIATLILFPFMLVVRATLLAVSPSNRNARWEKPDWKSRPFLRQGPHHVLHLFASVSVASGLGASIAYVTNQNSDLVSSIIPTVMGGGVFLGMSMTQGIFAGRYKPASDDAHEVQLPLRNQLMIATAWFGGFLLVAGTLGVMAYLTYLSLPVPEP